MARYEIIREIFNECSNNQMRDVEMRELDIESIDALMKAYRTGARIEEQQTTDEDGSVVIDLTVDGLRQRFTFTEA